MTKERPDVLSLTFLGRIQSMRKRSHSSGGFVLGPGKGGGGEGGEATGISGDAHLHPDLGAGDL